MPQSDTLLFVGNLFFSRFVPYLRQRGLKAVLVATSGDDGVRECDRVVSALPNLSAPDMVKLAVEQKVRGVVTKVLASQEHTVVRDAVAKEVLERDYGIRMFAPSLRAAVVTVDKGYTRDLLTSNGILMPRGAVVATLEELEEATEMLRFPLVMKVPDGSFSQSVVCVESRRELSDAYRRLGAARVVVEEFISGQEISVEVLSWDGMTAVQPAAYLGDTNLAVNPHGKVRICPYFPPKMQRAISKVVLQIADLLQAQGILQVDLVYDGEQLYVLEINGRFGGTSDLSSLASGRSMFDQAIEMVTGCWRPSESVAPAVCVEIPVLVSDFTSTLLHVPQSPLRYIRSMRDGVGMATLASPHHEELLEFVAGHLHLPTPDLMPALASALERAGRSNSTCREAG